MIGALLFFYAQTRGFPCLILSQKADLQGDAEMIK